MNVLEEVSKMKHAGKSEKEIIQTLQEQKVPPKQIVDALEQSEIKKAVTGETNPGNSNNQQSYQMAPLPKRPQKAMAPPAPSSQPAPAPTNKKEESQTPSYNYKSSKKEEPVMPNYNYEPPQEQEDYYQPEPAYNNAPEEYEDYSEYPEYDQGYSQPSMESSPDTIIDIAEQVYSEKAKKTNKKLDNLTEFKSMAELKLENLDSRLKRMERVIDQLQLRIIDKVGAYGTNIELIKKEMAMIEESFAKMVGKKPKRAAPKKRKTTTKKKKK